MNGRRLIVLAVAALLGGCFGMTSTSRAPIDIGTPGSWSSGAVMPSARQEVAVAALGDRVVVIGGMTPVAEPVSTVEGYRPSTNTWETLAPLPAPTHHAAAAVIDGRLFVMGGYQDRVPPWRPVRTVYEYDARRNSWATRSPMLIARGAHAAAVVGGRIHVVGGDDGGPLNAHEAYDAGADRWTRLPPMPTAREHLAAVAFHDRLWAIGGRSSFWGTQYATVEIYDPSGDRWEPGPPIPEARGGLAAAVLADRIFVLGGEAPFRIFGGNEMYEAVGNRWIAKDPMPTPRHGTAAAVLDGRIWVPGGATRPTMAATDVNEAYTR